MARTLLEAYAGMLSRDWDTLLKIIEGGEQRFHLYRHRILGRTKDWHGVARPSPEGYELHGLMLSLEEHTRDEIISQLLEVDCIGWIPAPDDNPNDLQKDDRPRKVDWHGDEVYVDDGLMGRLEWVKEKQEHYFIYGVEVFCMMSGGDDDLAKKRAEEKAIELYNEEIR